MRERTTCPCRVLLFLLLFTNGCDIFRENKLNTILCAQADVISVEGKINNGPQFSYNEQPIRYYNEGDIIEYTCKRTSNNVTFVQWSQIKNNETVFYGCYGNKDSITFRMKVYHKLDHDSVIECAAHGSNNIVQSIGLKITVRGNVSPLTTKIVKGTQVAALYKEMECDNTDILFAASIDNKIITMTNIWNISKEHDGMTLYCTSLNKKSDGTRCVFERKIGTMKQINVVDNEKAKIGALQPSNSFREVAKYVGMGVIIVLIVLVVIVCVTKKRKINQETQIEDRQELEAEPVNVTPHVIYAELQLGNVRRDSDPDQRRDNEETAYAEIIGVVAPRELIQED